MQALIDYDGWRKWKDINKGTAADKNKPDSDADKKGKGKGAMLRNQRLSTGGVNMMATSSGSGSEGTEIAAGA